MSRLDQQWIHVDVDRATGGPFGAPIAHGHLTQSIMGHLPGTQAVPGQALDGQKLGINYGFDKVRFPTLVASRGGDLRRRQMLHNGTRDQPVHKSRQPSSAVVTYYGLVISRATNGDCYE